MTTIPFIPDSGTRVGRNGVAIRLSDGVLLYADATGEHAVVNPGTSTTITWGDLLTGGAPGVLGDDELLPIGDDGEGGLINDVINGNGRVLYVGDLTYTDAVSLVNVQPGVASIFAQNDNDVYDAYVTALADDTSATVNVKAEKTTNPQTHSLLTLHDTGVTDLELTGLAPSFNIHDNLAVVNPFSTPAAPTVSESVDAGTVTAGTHKVAIVWNTAAGQTDVGVKSAQVVAAGDKKLTVDWPSVPVGVLTADVYMTAADDGAGDLLLVEAAVDLTPGFYNIDKLDGALGAVAPTVNTAGGNLSVAARLNFPNGATSWMQGDAAEGIQVNGVGATFTFLRDAYLVGKDQIYMHSVNGMFLWGNHEGSGWPEIDFNSDDDDATLVFTAGPGGKVGLTLGDSGGMTPAAAVGLYGSNPVVQGAHQAVPTAAAIYAQLELMGIFAAS